MKGKGLDNKINYTTMKDERLDQLSDKVRAGIPISFMEAIEIIQYQESIKKPKKVTLWQRFKQVISPGALG